jgi:hypothetical protein
MLGQPVACRTGCNQSLAVQSILSNGGNRNLCLVATCHRSSPVAVFFQVVQLDFQTLDMDKMEVSTSSLYLGIT